MPAHRKKHVLRPFAICVLMAGLLWSGYRYGVTQYKRTSVSDTVQVTAQTVRGLLQENPDPTDQQLRDAVVSLDKASVVRLWYDADGRVADAWGTPLSIEFTSKQPTAPVTCRSAGPDREMGTTDDIVFTCGR